MILRKLNAVLSLLVTAMLMNHAMFHGIWMLTGGAVAIRTPEFMPWALFILMMVHAVLSIVLGVLGHKGAEKRECKSYGNLNIPTNIQRASGVLLIIFTILHVAGAVGILVPPPLVHAILPPLFFTVVFMHTAVSVSKAFITLGIGSARFIKTADIVIKVICVLTLIVDVVGFYLFLV
jgi:hypothetical protein